MSAHAVSQVLSTWQLPGTCFCTRLSLVRVHCSLASALGEQLIGTILPGGR